MLSERLIFSYFILLNLELKIKNSINVSFVGNRHENSLICISLNFYCVLVMPIKYCLHRNAISNNPESHKAMIIPIKVHGLQSIISQMLQRGTTLAEVDILASLHLFFEVVVQEFTDGNHVNLPIVNIKPSITGEFDSASDRYDIARHQIKTTTSPGILLKRNIKKSTVEKVNKPSIIPILLVFTDMQSQTINDKITPNGIAQIEGKNLKFTPANPSEGLFFVNENNQTFQATIFAIRHPSKLIFSIPDAMPPGTYTLIIKKNFGKTATTLRKGTLPFTLNVV